MKAADPGGAWLDFFREPWKTPGGSWFHGNSGDFRVIHQDFSKKNGGFFGDSAMEISDISKKYG